MTTLERKNFSISFFYSTLLHILFFVIGIFTFMKQNPILIPKSTFISIEIASEIKPETFKTVKKLKSTPKKARRKFKPAQVKDRIVSSEIIEKKKPVKEMKKSWEMVEEKVIPETKAVESSPEIEETQEVKDDKLLTETDLIRMSQTEKGALILGDRTRTVVFSPSKPEYPEWARKLGIEATILIKAWFSPFGVVTSTEIIKSSGYNELDIISQKYVKKYRISATPGADDDTFGFILIKFEL